jgi:DNA invertase Pin-like site-specific DNA recombinase
MSTPAKATAVAYFRTSSATNVGADKDTLPRQRAAVLACADARGLEVVKEFRDDAVSGADPVDTRKGFAEMLQYMLGNGARTIIVENASRFARDLIVQETGYAMLKAQGIELIAADAPDSFLSDTPTAVLIRQILGAVHQFDKAMLVEKLAGARKRKRLATERNDDGHRCDGNPNFRPLPLAAIEAARKLRGPADDPEMSLRAISADLAARGLLSSAGKPYSVESVARMLGERSRRTLRRA